METLTKPTATKPSMVKEEIRIFIIDDDPMYLQVLGYQLRKQINYKIYSFKTGEECFKHMSLLDPDIVILDYRLNDSNPKAMNGLEILKRLKGIKPDISVLMLSSQESFEIATNSIRYGAFDYIIKNESAFVRVQHLINKILNYVKLQRAAKEKEKYSILLIVIGVMAIILPAILQYITPNKISWITLTILFGYFALALIINKTKLTSNNI